MVYIKKRTIIICIILAIALVGLLIWGLSPTTILKPTDDPTQPVAGNNTDIEMNRVATKSWANGKWLGDVDKNSITAIVFTNEVFHNVQASKAWEYDGFTFAVNLDKDKITIYVPNGMKMKGSLHGAFQDMTNLQSVTGFAYFDTSECTEMSSMFANCTSLIAVDAPNMKTDNVLTANKMFFNCASLEHIDLTKCNMQKAVDMSEMFADCFKAINIGLPKTRDVTTLQRAFYQVGMRSSVGTNLIGSLNTPNCIDMSEMFAHAMINDYKVAEQFDTQSLQTAKSMFESCGLKQINLSNWNTGNLVTTEKMFSENTWSETIDVSGWNAEKLKNTSDMFYYCSNLRKLNLNWSNANTVTDAHAMFMYCFSLIELNLTGFNNTQIGITQDMFAGCSELQNIYCTNITSDVSERMFRHCRKLNGLTPYDENRINGAMATTDGYFTQPPTNVTVQ